MIALDKDLLKELKGLGIIFIVLFLVLQVVFFKENPLIILRTSIAIFWMFILPGFSIIYYWKEKLGFVERSIISFAVSSGVIGTLSYYLGLLGLNILYHTILLPAVVIAIGVLVNIKKSTS